jgi:hypothetical protein
MTSKRVPDTLCLLVLLLGTSEMATGQAAPACVPAAADTLWKDAGTVLHACEVDTPAKRRGGDPKLDLDPFKLRARTPCQRVTLGFVVDTLGAVEAATLRVVSSDHLLVEAAVRQAVSKLAYVPARKAGQAVRQIVLYSRAVATPAVERFTARMKPEPLDAPVADAPRNRAKDC